MSSLPMEAERETWSRLDFKDFFLVTGPMLLPKLPSWVWFLPYLYVTFKCFYAAVISRMQTNYCPTVYFDNIGRGHLCTFFDISVKKGCINNYDIHGIFAAICDVCILRVFLTFFSCVFRTCCHRRLLIVSLSLSLFMVWLF